MHERDEHGPARRAVRAHAASRSSASRRSLIVALAIGVCGLHGSYVGGGGQAAAAQGAAGPAQSSVLDGVFSKAQADRGEKTFSQVCAACHTLSDMAGAKFRSRWADGAVGDIYEFVMSAMPDGDPGSLKPEEYAQVIAYFLEQSGYPAGERELPADKVALAKVKILPLPR